MEALLKCIIREGNFWTAPCPPSQHDRIRLDGGLNKTAETIQRTAGEKEGGKNRKSGKKTRYTQNRPLHLVVCRGGNMGKSEIEASVTSHNLYGVKLKNRR